MAKADTVYSLFGMKTPQQVAKEQYEKNQQILQTYSKTPEGMAGSAIGLGLRRLFSGPSDEMQTAERGQAAIAKAREAVAQKRTAEAEAQATQALSIEAAVANEEAGLGAMPKPPEPTREEQLMKRYIDNSELYDTMATHLAEAGLQTESEAARTEATNQRLGALKVRKTLADVRKTEGELATQNRYKNMQINQNNYMDAVNTFIQNGDVTEGLRLLDIYTADPSTLQKDLNMIMGRFFPNADSNDPKALQLAMDKLIDYKRADQKGISAFKQVQERIDDSWDTTKSAARKMPLINGALKTLDEGRVNIGSLTNSRQGAERLYELALQAAGVDTSDQTAVARTESLLAETGFLATEMLASGVYGSGTGLSEKDLEDAKRLSGAGKDLTPDGMRRILELNARMAKAKVEAHNNLINNLNPKYWEDNPYKKKDNYIIEIEPLYSAIPQSATSWADAAPKGGRRILDSNGKEVRLVSGKYVYEDGTEYTGQ